MADINIVLRALHHSFDYVTVDTKIISTCYGVEIRGRSVSPE